MNRYHKKRMFTIFLFLFSLAVATSLILFSLKKNLNVFLTPSDITTSHIESDHPFRLGGFVKNDSVRRGTDNLSVEFVVTDFKQDISVRYQGILPDLFREGKGAIAEGHLVNGIFIATQILAKHDENYKPDGVMRA